MEAASSLSPQKSFRFSFTDYDTVAGTHRVNKNEISEVKQAKRVIGQGVRRCPVIPVGLAVYLYQPGTKQTHMQPHGSRPGAPIEDKSDRAIGRIRHIISQVGYRPEGSLRFILLIGQEDILGDYIVEHRLAVNFDLMLGLEIA